MSYTATRISRLQSQLAELDTVIAAFEAGNEETQVGSVRYRKSSLASLIQQRAGLEAQLSKLYALQANGGRTLLRRGSF